MNQNIKTTTVIFRGGLNLASSVLELDAGEAVQLFNYEVNTLGRYQRLMGYERFDGRPAPSDTRAADLGGYPFVDDETEAAAVTAEKDARRAVIEVVEGSGPIRGVVYYNQRVYAFRDSADGTECVMWASSVNGWERVATPALAPSGRYEFAIANFGASSSSIKLYGVDGVNDLFEFDGDVFKQITSPVEGKHPTHLEILASQVIVTSFEGGTFTFSAVGDPFDFVNGGEIGTGDEITGLDLQANNSMAVFCQNRTYMLYGTSKADFQLQDVSKNTGASSNSIQTLGESVYLDDRGLTRLSRVQEFGNFDSASISQKVEPLLNNYIRRATASMVVREKNQYRICFDDGTGLICTFYGKEVSGFSTFDLQKTVRCAFSGEDASTGKEVIFFGSDDGYVYQIEKGFSFDGDPIPHVLRPAFNSLGNPEYKKRWRKVALELDTLSKVTLTCVPDFDYSSPLIPYHVATEVNPIGGGGYWDEGAWDETKWSNATTITSDIYVDGLARNMSVTFSGETTEEAPHIINNMIIHYSPRGRRR